MTNYGLPKQLPESIDIHSFINDETAAPKRILSLSKEETEQAIRNALRYFPQDWHSELEKDFREELKLRGRIYMYRFKPKQSLRAKPILEYQASSTHAAAIMLMIDNNLDPKVAQHPNELITYGGNGAVFQNWIQYLLTMDYLAQMNENQTLAMYSGHPMGLFPSSPEAPRVTVTNGMMIPNYSKKEDWDKFNALGVTQYGQMTAGSYMYIGPQGIVHGTTITILNALRSFTKKRDGFPLFVSSGLGGMSGAQAKASRIAGVVGIIAEVNPEVLNKRHQQGWVEETFSDLEKLLKRVRELRASSQPCSLGYLGNVVDLWDFLDQNSEFVDLGSDQTSLHNPYLGGYYPQGISFEDSKKLMTERPEEFKDRVQASLRKHVDCINRHTDKGTYFFDYGNAFLLEASRAEADILKSNGDFRYPSYVEDIMGPMCFDYGFGPFRWVCASGEESDLIQTDKIAATYLREALEKAPTEIQGQLKDNLQWIEEARENQMVVGSQARILYADAVGRVEIGLRFNQAVADGSIKAPIILGRDHHDVSGTDSPYRETANIRDGSRFTADMAVQNFVGDACRGATWVSLHNGGGVGWGEVINGGFGLVLDGTEDAERKLKNMLAWDVNNGVARRAWAGNPGAIWAIQEASRINSDLVVTMNQNVD